MKYAELVDIYRRLDATSSGLEKTAILTEAFSAADEHQLPLLVKLVRGRLYAPWTSEELGVSSSLTQRAIAKATGVSEAEIEETWRETGDLGDAAAAGITNRTQRTLVDTELTVRGVHDALRELATYEGAGSEERRIDVVAGLLSDADPEEARYVVRTVLGHLRVGIGDGTVRDAIADAFLDGSEEAVTAVERAYQVTNDYREVAQAARDGGRDGLAELDIELFRPVEVMLARKAETLSGGLEDVAAPEEGVLLEYKFDGVRAQIHKRGADVRVFTRRLEDVTEQFPDAVAAIREHVTAQRCVLEGEIVGYDPDTRALVPFQALSKRIKRKYDIAEMASEIPVVVHLFDCLYLAGRALLDESARERLGALDGVLSPEREELERATHRTLPPADGANREKSDGGSSDGSIGSDGEDGAADDATRAFYEAALDTGHEGLMLKNLDATYQPGRRVGYMMKVKPVMEPLDLVVTRAQWSEGRRSDFLGRLFLGCRNPETGEIVEVGRLATGYTDEELRELTARLEGLVTEREGRRVDVEPEVVLEIEYEEIQRSPEYGSGFALRFPRFERIRVDLGPEDVDSLDRVRRLYEDQ
ncbi:DNA ligase [Halobacteriales archaeon QS_4_69_34]|nr:MAG: DNA ligase [Halobacteriales archaeon QS_4_69_34]